MNPVATLFDKALSWAAVYGSVMPTDVWDIQRERKARELAAQAAAEVTGERAGWADSVLSSLS